MMSTAITPLEFHGTLPRPRFFDNPRFNSHRARDAHWSSMGGLNFTILRLQGRIEGNVDELRAWLESSSPGESEEKKKKRSGCDYIPHAATVAVKRRRYVDVNGDEEEEEGVGRIIRNLSDDFDGVGGESKIIKKSNGTESVGMGLKEKKKKKKVEETSSMSSRLTRIIPLSFRF